MNELHANRGFVKINERSRMFVTIQKMVDLIRPSMERFVLCERSGCIIPNEEYVESTVELIYKYDLVEMIEREKPRWTKD